MYPLIEAATAHEHQEDLRREAAHDRLVVAVHRGTGWRVRLGLRLVRIGTRLACDATARPTLAV
jgi:hypothetical protein